MVKTPDEIKKGLECCTKPACADCPYDSEPSCVVKNVDALALIQQLEAKLSAEKDQHQYILDGALTLADEAAKFERERDALLHYLTNTHLAPCDICKHEPESHDINDCKRIREVGIPCFEWKGLPKV